MNHDRKEKINEMHGLMWGRSEKMKSTLYEKN